MVCLTILLWTGNHNLFLSFEKSLVGKYVLILVYLQNITQKLMVRQNK